MTQTQSIWPAPIEAYRERWEPGDEAYFEYHCWESDDSQDAALWHRSHQKVTVLRESDHDGWAVGNIYDRFAGAVYVIYRVRFPDGHEGDVYEEELFVSPSYYYRPDPPVNA